MTGDCREAVLKLENESINLVVTSPPYAQQRSKLYGGIEEEEFPGFIVSVMEAMKPKLTEEASVLMVIRSNVRDGVVSDYVMRTRLAVRDAGWKECEELIWLKTDAPPLGSTVRPRRTWENILWFCKTNRPYIDLKACGNPKSSRIGFAGSQRFGLGGDSPLAAHQNTEMRDGTSKVADHFVAYVGEIARGVKHPAMYPISLCEKLIKTFSRPGDVVLDPFAGSGQTLLAADATGRKWVGVEMKDEYVEIIRSRVGEHQLG